MLNFARIICFVGIEVEQFRTNLSLHCGTLQNVTVFWANSGRQDFGQGRKGTLSDSLVQRHKINSKSVEFCQSVHQLP